MSSLVPLAKAQAPIKGMVGAIIKTNEKAEGILVVIDELLTCLEKWQCPAIENEGDFKRLRRMVEALTKGAKK